MKRKRWASPPTGWTTAERWWTNRSALPSYPIPPSSFFVRNYGTILSNFAYSGPCTLKEGDTLLQRFRILVHEGTADDVDINSYLQKD